MTSSFDVCVCASVTGATALIYDSIYCKTSSCGLHQVQVHFLFFFFFFFSAASLVLLDKGQVLVDVVRGADHEGHPLVQRLRLDVQDPLGAGGGQASRLLYEEGNGVALVQQPQLWRERPGVIEYSNDYVITYFIDHHRYYYCYHHHDSGGVSDSVLRWCLL